jgi:hypothetical protein
MEMSRYLARCFERWHESNGELPQCKKKYDEKNAENRSAKPREWGCPRASSLDFAGGNVNGSPKE